MSVAPGIETKLGDHNSQTHNPSAGDDALHLIGKILGHRQARTTERDAHLRDDPLRAIADRTAGTIAAMLEGESGGIVLPLKSQRERG